MDRDGYGIPSVLVAEDDPPNRKVAVLMLRRLGYEVDSVADGMEVLHAINLQRYDIVLMDIQMPKMDGITTTRKIRECWPKGEQPIIIAITAYLLPDGRKRCLDAGMNDYIIKPVRMSELDGILKKHRARPGYLTDAKA